MWICRKGYLLSTFYIDIVSIKFYCELTNRYYNYMLIITYQFICDLKLLR